jgi:hypothetical protein
LRWSRTPAKFDVDSLAVERALNRGHITQQDDPLPPGYVTVSTLISLGDLLLDKSGGYLSNDRLSPALLLDNMPNWEYGVVIQLRTFANSLRIDLSRAGAQSTEWPQLVEADAKFNFDHNRWVLPSTEKQYREGLAFLEEHLDLLSGTGGSGSSEYFVLRPDNLDECLRRLERHLGSLTIRLRANANVYAYNPFLLDDEEQGSKAETEAPQTTTPRTKVDDVFFEARGHAFVMYHMLKALRTDYAEVLRETRSLGSMNRALSEFNAALQPLKSPIVLNGEDFGPTPNHSITLSAYLAKAHLAIIDMRNLLRATD